MARPRTRSADPGNLATLPASAGKGSGGSTLASVLVEALEEAILDGTLIAGERLNADVLAEHYGISRVPVREALRALDAHGWVVMRPRLGYYVRPKSEEELQDLFETRLVLEPAAAALAAERRSTEQMQQLRAIVARAKGEVGIPDGTALARSNQDFHRLLALATGNSVLISMLEPLGKRVRFYTVTADSRRTTSVEEHALLVDAIGHRDDDRAAALARDHVLNTRRSPELPSAKVRGPGRQSS